jgi:CBS domain-containing protein
MDDQLRIKDWMKRDVVFVSSITTIRQAASLIFEKRVGTLPVVDENGMLIGVTSINDIIQVFLPDFVSLLEDIGFIKDYGVLKFPSAESMEKAEKLAVVDIMREPVAVDDSSSLIRALSVMHKCDLQDLIVVKEGKLVGIASRVDIGRAFLTSWLGS